MQRGDDYRVDWTFKLKEEVEEARARGPGWRAFQHECAEVEVYFDRYERRRKAVTVQVFTTVPHPQMDRVALTKFLCEGEGHDVVSASIDGMRRSGGSSLKCWIAALAMQIDQLVEMMG